MIRNQEKNDFVIKEKMMEYPSNYGKSNCVAMRKMLCVIKVRMTVQVSK